MGRPLKISKAQAIITLTDTAAATDIVTTSANLTNLGIIAGMPFVVASNIGGLVAGTPYWILQVLSATTFTVSATDLSSNPTSAKVDLSATSGQTIAATIAPVDNYFNNPTGGTGWPATNANTYSVVGGNTSIYGSQVLCNVAIGVNGTGTLYANTANANVIGLGTDFANVATGTILFAVEANGAQSLLGTTTATKGNLNVVVANTTAAGNIIGTSGNAQTLRVDTPVVFTANFGNLTTNTTYFVKTIANAAAFTVSTTLGGDPVALTSNASVTANAVQNRVVLGAVSSNAAVGLSFVQALPEAGFIVRQKGKQKYLVTGTTSGLTGACYTANVANTALTPNTMTILATYANASTQRVQSISDHTVELFTATSGPVATGNIVLGNADPAFGTFNTAAVANAEAGLPYPLVTIGSA